MITIRYILIGCFLTLPQRSRISMRMSRTKSIFNSFNKSHGGLTISFILHTFLLNRDNIESLPNTSMQMNNQVHQQSQVRIHHFLILYKLRLLPNKIYIKLTNSHKIIYYHVQFIFLLIGYRVFLEESL